VLTSTDLSVTTGFSNSTNPTDVDKIFSDNNSNIFSLTDKDFYYEIFDLLNNIRYDFVPKMTFDWYSDKTVTVTTPESSYVQNIFNLTTLGAYDTEFSGEAFFNSYSTFNDLTTIPTSTSTLISPHLSGRVLFNTIWKNGQFNTGVNNSNSAYTAHLVSSRWLSGRFRGSWDTPRFLDHFALRQESVFLGGIFGDAISGDANSSLTAVWNDGLFLGGTWRTGQFPC
jgi:hypothetical protein